METKNNKVIVQFKDVIDSPLSGLISIQASSLLCEGDDTFCYLAALIAYFKGELAALTRSKESFDEGAPIRLFIEMRIAVLTSEVNSKQIEEFVSLILKLTSDPAFIGEAYFIAGYASYTLHNYAMTISYYQKALPYLELCGAQRKHLKTSQNLLAARTNLDPSMKCIPDYQELQRQASRLNDMVTSGLCHLNISREYQKLGLLNIALETANFAVEELESDHGVNHYYLARLHRAHLLIQMGIEHQAFIDIEACSSTDFNDVRAAIRVLENIDFQTENAVRLERLNPTWQARSRRLQLEKYSQLKFNDLEERVITQLSAGPVEKNRLIDQIYGTKIDFLSAEARLKNVIARIRKKSPSIIVYRNGEFSLANNLKPWAKKC